MNPLPGTGRWAARLPKAHAAAVAALRLEPGVEVCETADAVWLRGPAADPALDLRLRRMPGAERFESWADGRVSLPGTRLPVATIPRDGWVAAASFASPAVQEAAGAGFLTQRVNLRVERGLEEQPAGILVCALDAWTAWASGAAAIRLRALAFAASPDGRAAVRGSPLPPLPGLRFTDADGIAVPCGLVLRPAADPATLRAVLGLEPGDVALFHEDATWERLPASSFVRASRSAARAIHA